MAEESILVYVYREDVSSNQTRSPKILHLGLQFAKNGSVISRRGSNRMHGEEHENSGYGALKSVCSRMS